MAIFIHFIETLLPFGPSFFPFQFYFRCPVSEPPAYPLHSPPPQICIINYLLIIIPTCLMRRRLESRSCSSPSCSRGLSLSTSKQNSFRIEQTDKATKKTESLRTDKPTTVNIRCRSLALIKGLGGSVADRILIFIHSGSWIQQKKEGEKRHLVSFLFL